MLSAGVGARAGHSDHQKPTRPSLRQTHASCKLQPARPAKRSVWCLAATSRSTGLDSAVGTWAWLTIPARIVMASGCTTSRTRMVTRRGTIYPRWGGCRRNPWTKRRHWYSQGQRACPRVRHRAHNLSGRQALLRRRLGRLRATSCLVGGPSSCARRRRGASTRPTQSRASQTRTRSRRRGSVTSRLVFTLVNLLNNFPSPVDLLYI